MLLLKKNNYKNNYYNLFIFYFNYYFKIHQLKQTFISHKFPPFLTFLLI